MPKILDSSCNANQNKLIFTFLEFFYVLEQCYEKNKYRFNPYTS